MINPTDFKDVVDSRFWKKAARLQLTEVPERGEVLDNTCEKINKGIYSPSSPVIVMEQDKGHGIVRHIPVFSMVDYSVYYYCVRKLDRVLAKKRVPNTFGGWSLGGRIRELEEEEGRYSLEYELSFSFDPRAWSKYYGEFNSKLYKQLLEYKRREGYRAVEFDIANYYDSVRLDMLERQIRSDGDFQETEILNLLFYFLGYRDRRLSAYSPLQVGLPQDAIGDCSRLLANYYIQGYDQFMHKLLEENQGSYFRFADDQFVFCKESNIKKILQAASRKLFGKGLNINQLKVKVWGFDELIINRSFEIFEILSALKKDDLKKKINEYTQKTFAIAKPEELKNRGFPLLKKLVTYDFNLLKPDLRAQLIGRVTSKDFTYSSQGYVMASIYGRLRAEEKRDYLVFLKECSDECLHNAFHYELVVFAETSELPEVKRFAFERILELNAERLTTN